MTAIFCDSKTASDSIKRAVSSSPVVKAALIQSDLRDWELRNSKFLMEKHLGLRQLL